MAKITSDLMLKIDDVDLPNKSAHCITNQGSKVVATFRASSAAFQIPMQGERWRAERVGYQWHLLTRWDEPTESTLKYSLQPGDVHMRVPGNLHTDANLIVTPAGPIGAAVRENIHPDGSNTSYVLSGSPVNDETVMIYKNGVYLHPGSDYNSSGPIIFFSATPLTTDKITVHYQRGNGLYRDKSVVTSIAAIQSDDIHAP